MTFGALLSDPSRIDVPGEVDARVLVVSGVHGSELSGIEVAQRLIGALAARPNPYYSVTVVPELFRENAGRARTVLTSRTLRENKSPRELTDSNEGRYTRLRGTNYTDPNRQLPYIGHCAPGRPYGPRYDATAEEMEAENVYLVDLIGDLKPARIISIHAIRHRPQRARNPDGSLRWRQITSASFQTTLPGVFVDPVTTLPVDVTRAQPRTRPPADDSDALALEAARFLDARWYEATQSGALTSYYGDLFDHWAPGNWLSSDRRAPTARYPTPGEVREQEARSLGEWGPRAVTAAACRGRRRPGIPVFTIEVRRYYPSTAFDPLLAASSSRGSEEQKRRWRSEQRERELELQAHADAIREVLLERDTGSDP